MVVTIRFTPTEMFNEKWKYDGWQAFVKGKFKEQGFEVIENTAGLELKRADSDLVLMYEISGVVGKTLRRIDAV